MFRKGKRQLRKTLRGRAEESDVVVPVTPPNEGNPPPPVIVGGATPEGSSSSSSKERLQEWICQQSSCFLESVREDSNPALEVVTRLADASERLHPKSPSCLAALSVSQCACLSEREWPYGHIDCYNRACSTFHTFYSNPY